MTDAVQLLIALIIVIKLKKEFIYFRSNKPHSHVFHSYYIEIRIVPTAFAWQLYIAISHYCHANCIRIYSNDKGRSLTVQPESLKLVNGRVVCASVYR